MTDRVIGRSRDREIGKALSCCSVKQARVPELGTSTTRRIYGFLSAVFKLLGATIREIFDEAAYARYLARAQDTPSVGSYRAFLQERETGIARRPRCC